MNYSIIPLSRVRADSARIDAEHYQEVYLTNQAKLSSFGATSLKHLLSMPVVTGHTPSMESHSYYGGRTRFIKTDNLREFRITQDFRHYLSESGNAAIRRSELRPKDLIVAIIGADYKIVGRAAVVREKDLPANINQNIALIRPQDHQSSEFLCAYLNSKIGRHALWYLSRQTEQVNLNCREIEEVLVPQLSGSLIRAIESTYNVAIQFEDESETAFAEAHSILLSELGLDDWQPKHQPSFVTSYSEASQAGRLDADYFQPKYDGIFASIESYPGGWDTLGNLVMIRKGVEVGSREYIDEGVPFVRVSNLSPFEISEEKYVSEELCALIKQHQPEQGEILFSKDATPGIAHYLRGQPQRLIPSSGILRLKSKTDKMVPECLTLALNSILTKQQAERDVGGSVILHWTPAQIARVAIPILVEEAQIQIQQLAVEGSTLHQQSKRLLECAKRAVEIAIEHDEKTAIAWLDSENTKAIKNWGFESLA